MEQKCTNEMSKGEKKMMNTEILATLGLFFIAALGYAFITGIAGILLSIGDENDSSMLCSAYFIGCLMYAITVVLMWQG